MNIERSKNHLANEVGIFIFLEGDGTLPEVTVSALISLTNLGLGESVILFLLSEVLIEGQRIVFLFLLPATIFTLRLVFSGSNGCSLTGGGIPRRSIAACGTPCISASLFSRGVDSSFSLDLQLGFTLIASPSLVNLLLTVTIEIVKSK